MKRKTEDCSFRTSIGGQALIEGILMRGPKKQAVVCRTKDGRFVLLHDRKLDRVTNGKGKVMDRTLAEIKICQEFAFHNDSFLPLRLFSGSRPRAALLMSPGARRK